MFITNNVILLLNILFFIAFFSFITNLSSFIHFLVFSEIVWIILFLLTLALGSLHDDLNLLTLSFFLLGFATIEFVVAYLLIIIFKKNNISTNFLDNDTKHYDFLIYNLKKLNSLNANWN